MQDTLQITLVDGREIEVFMSYALANTLAGLIGDPTRVITMGMDVELSSAVLLATLIPRTPGGKPSVNIDEFELPNLSMAEADRLLEWIKEQILDFFMRRMENSLKLMTDRKGQIMEIGLSLTGLTVEPLKN